jgi:hypothetical protein
MKSAKPSYTINLTWLDWQKQILLGTCFLHANCYVKELGVGFKNYQYRRLMPSNSQRLFPFKSAVAINDCVHRVTSMENDQSGMGRWSLIQLSGKNQTSICLITAYRCVKNIHGPLSTWNQQRFILDSQDRTDDPITAFDTELINSIKKWLSLGDQVILGIDVNEDVRNGSFAR